jgi:hypothetical protein
MLPSQVMSPGYSWHDKWTALSGPLSNSEHDRYIGADGGPCSSCDKGTYKAVRGTGTCIECLPGTYQPLEGAGPVALCLNCPNNSHSSQGSYIITNCTCKPGYTGAEP